jgi:tetratricopeptide (TPR) repeat protein
MIYACRISWLLTAALLLPLIASAQTAKFQSTVSVRELGIPSNAAQDFQKGIDRLSKDDAAGGLLHFQRAIRAFASYYEAYFEMGIADLKLSRAADAEQALRKSIELSAGRYAEPRFALGGLLIQQSKFTEGEKIIREALSLDPTSWAGQYCLGWALLGLNRFAEAEKSVREALRLKPDSTDSYLLLADIHGRLRDYPARLHDLDEYLKLEPHSEMNEKVRLLREKAEQEVLWSDTSAVLEPEN